jgi:hypothetical protein
MSQKRMAARQAAHQVDRALRLKSCLPDSRLLAIAVVLMCRRHHANVIISGKTCLNLFHDKTGLPNCFAVWKQILVSLIISSHLGAG